MGGCEVRHVRISACTCFFFPKNLALEVRFYGLILVFRVLRLEITSQWFTRGSEGAEPPA